MKSKVEISIPQAILGGYATATGLYGNLKVFIPRGTSSHQTVSIKNEGFPRSNTYGKGDHLVELVIKSPTRVSSNQRAIMTAFAKEDPDYSGQVEGLDFTSHNFGQSKSSSVHHDENLVDKLSRIIRDNQPMKRIYQEFFSVIRDLFDFLFSRRKK